MPSIPEKPLALPKYKYHYSKVPKMRMSNERIMKAVWDNETVITRGSLSKKHLLVGNLTLCGIHEYQCTRSPYATWEGIYYNQCYRCKKSISLITEYLLKCEESETPSGMD